MKLLRLNDDAGHTYWALMVKTHAIAVRELLTHPWASLIKIVGWLRASHEGGIG